MGDSMDDEREQYLFSALNAAANLYGVISVEEFLGLVNGYLAVRRETPFTAEEIRELAADPIDLSETWFALCEEIPAAGPLIVSSRGFLIEGTETEPDRVDVKAVEEQMAVWKVKTVKTLPELEFLYYNDPYYSEESGAGKRFAKFLRQEYGFGKDEALDAVEDVQAEIRFEPGLRVALYSSGATLGLEIADRGQFEDLVDRLSPLVGATRAWNYRGHKESELVADGVLSNFATADVEDLFSWFMGGCRPVT